MMGLFVETLTLQAAAGATGNGTAMDVSGLAAAAVQVEGISTATITFEGTIDGSTWYAVRNVNITSGAAGTTATADGIYLIPTAGLLQLRARISAWTSGTITATAVGVVNGGQAFALVSA